ncbi:DMT family transporter [Ferrimonas lipolytica]|uniref:DMT family transporter n=1 Tax=Ferrimonas lipolytica TaxID=2724191 RepID=A0A6H1UAP8_9GAMM|nr:DMT family transporter [Ferrimonas lipolytica]QIZ75908.1 DMT family transporter [Ferrimonas lipolytica]
MKNQTRALQFGFAAVLCWSTVATAFKLALEHQSPAQLVLFASLFSCVILLIIVAVKGQLSQLGRQWRQAPLHYLRSGILNPFLYYAVLFAGYDRLPAQQAQALNYTWVIVLSFLAVPMLKQKLKLWDLVAALFAYCGVVVIATGGDFSTFSVADPTGIVLILTSTILWALYWIVNTKQQGNAIAGLLLGFLVSLPLSAALCWYRGELTIPNWQGLAGAAYVGMFEMGITFVLWLTAMRLAEHTASLSNLAFLGPFMSLMFISQILGEAIASATVIGLMMIIAGLILQKIGPKVIKLVRRTNAPAPTN